MRGGVKVTAGLIMMIRCRCGCRCHAADREESMNGT